MMLTQDHFSLVHKLQTILLDMNDEASADAE